MAIIAISRQVAALGDEIAGALAKELSYKFIDRKPIERRIVELGFAREKLPKYDERKPNFFANLLKDRDEYLNYLQYAVLEAASQGNCILIGRGAFIILSGISNLISLRFVADDNVRIERLEKEFNWNKKQALQRISESDSNRLGFHKSFFNLENENPKNFTLTLNTGILNIDESVKVIKNLVQTHITPQKETDGQKKLLNLLKAQSLVNDLIFECHIKINFLRSSISDDGKNLVLYGVADSQSIAQTAVQIASRKFPELNIRSEISIVQDFKNYH